MTKKVDEKTSIHYPASKPGLTVRPSSTTQAQKAKRAREARAALKRWVDADKKSGNPWAK